jgi:hypothetical protein
VTVAAIATAASVSSAVILSTAANIHLYPPPPLLLFSPPSAPMFLPPPLPPLMLPLLPASCATANTAVLPAATTLLPFPPPLMQLYS